MSSIYTKRLRITDGVIAYTEEEIQDIYKEVLGGSRLKFPRSLGQKSTKIYWEIEDGENTQKICINTGFVTFRY